MRSPSLDHHVSSASAAREADYRVWFPLSQHKRVACITRPSAKPLPAFRRHWLFVLNDATVESPPAGQGIDADSITVNYLCDAKCLTGLIEAAINRLSIPELATASDQDAHQ